MCDFRKNTIKYDAKKLLEKLDNESLFIYSETSLNKIEFSNENIKKINWHNITKRIDDINKIIAENKTVTQVVSLGGGSAIDIAKYMAYKLNVKFICIPSMLSTNSYATNKVALIDNNNNNKITLDAKIPDCIVLDCDLLKKSVIENLYGLADVLSIYIALYDWKIAFENIDEKIDEKIFEMALELLYRVKNFILNNSLENISNDIEQLFEYIGISGYITNLYGTGRPESGSEHIFAKNIESIINVPHGIAVSLGIILMAIMQERDSDKEEIISAIKKIKVLDRCKEYDVNMNVIENALMTLLPRNDRYTIVDEFYNNTNYKTEKLRLFKEYMKDEKI